MFFFNNRTSMTCTKTFNKNDVRKCYKNESDCVCLCECNQSKNQLGEDFGYCVFCRELVFFKPKFYENR